MKALGLLGVLIVLVAIGALIAYLWTRWAIMKQKRKDQDTPWKATDGERDGKWVVYAYRPGHDEIILSEQDIEAGFLSDAINQARADAYENFMALTPRGEWEL